MRTESRNCTEMALDWRIEHCIKRWMHSWISVRVIFSTYNLFKILKQMNYSKRRNSVFCFFLKNWENADTAFCILADDIKINPHRKYFPRELQIRQTNECAARVCLSDLQVSREIFPVSESQCGLINIVHSFSQNILNSFLSVSRF